MPELDTITIKGFKSIASVEMLKLGAINVLVGPNGSGKSNFIGVFSFLNAIRGGRLQDYVIKAGGADKVLHFGSRITSELSIRISFMRGVNQYELKLQPTESDELAPTEELVYYWHKEKYPGGPMARGLSRLGNEAGISGKVGDPVAKYVREHLSSWRLYHVHDTSSSSPMKKTADINDNHYLRHDGSNLAPFLYYLREKHNDSYSLIRRTIQQVAPFFDDFLLEPQKLNPEKIKLEWRHKDSDAYFDASSLSDGSIRFMALATLFLQPRRYHPSVILIDEPELGLHPYAITMLASLVKIASKRTQVIVATQSPLLLDHFQPEDVLVTDRKDGCTTFRRLESAPLEKWLEDYSLGQLWEKNEFGGRPGGN